MSHIIEIINVDVRFYTVSNRHCLRKAQCQPSKTSDNDLVLVILKRKKLTKTILMFTFSLSFDSKKSEVKMLKDLGDLALERCFFLFAI